MKRFALAGNPNCGKTTLFNALTGATAHVGNWPGVTVDKKEGTYKKCPEPVSIIDLPGIYSLSPYTPEEVISRNFILDEDPDCVINIIDATNLERNLYLTTQLIEMDVPVVVALNMIDVIEKNGEKIDVEALEKEIGCPVIAISAQKGTNIESLMNKAYNESLKKRQGKTVLENGTLIHVINDVKAAFIGLGVKHPLFHAIKLVENDEIETKNHPDLVKIVDEFKKNYTNEIFEDDLEAVVADDRYTYISKYYGRVKEKKNTEEKDKLTLSDKIDKVLTNRWAGIPIFLIILCLIFRITFAENLFWFTPSNSSFEGTMFEGLIWTDAGLNSPGVFLQTFLTAITDWFTGVVQGWLESANASSWVTGLVCDGILAGIFSVLSFVPQILLLFLFFSILEDSGYMARVAFILDKIFRKFGLTGRAFMPMIMGFGCSVPAMINTRTLAEERERTATIRVIPFFSCGAKLPILTAIAGGVAQAFNFPHVWLITFSMYILGVCVAIITALIMRHTTMRGPLAPFIMELPSYHFPQFKALMIHLWDKLKHFVKKAFTIILVSTVVIWFLQSFTFDWKYIEQANPMDTVTETYDSLLEDDEFVASLEELEGYEEAFTEEGGYEAFAAAFEENEEDEAYIAVNDKLMNEAFKAYVEVVTDPEYKDTGDSILAGFGKLIQPIFTPLGFGKNLNEKGWVFGVSAVTGLIAKENVIATFAVLAQCSESVPTTVEEFKALTVAASDEEGVDASVTMINNTGIIESGRWAALIAFIVFNMTTIPCFAAVATAKGELDKKRFWSTIGFWLATSYITSMIVFVCLRWYWPIAIVLALFVALGFGLHYFNKYRDAKVTADN
ncbi:MAG: ferrous iron transport protein B [Acholeplasmatales bacterium]|nr:ferrous iron transport protein B [Acholeplasmatales bacterium]